MALMWRSRPRRELGDDVVLRKRPSGVLLGHGVPGAGELGKRGEPGLGPGAPGRPLGRGNAGHPGHRYLREAREVLLDSEAAHPAVALRPGAAQRRQ